MSNATCPRCLSALVIVGSILKCKALEAWEYERSRFGNDDSRRELGLPALAACPCDYTEVRREFVVPAVNLDALRARLAKTAARAKRCGTEAPVLTVGETVEVDFYSEALQRKIKRTCYRVTISGEAPRINGWTFAAALDHDGEENIIGAVIDGIPAQYRSANPACDHCGTKRRRAATFVIRSDAGEWKQIGRSCLKDFFGHTSPQGIASAAECIAEACDAAQDCCGWDEGGSGSGDPEIGVYLAWVAMVIRTDGWTSRKASSDGVHATCDMAAHAMYDCAIAAKRRERVAVPSEDDHATAESALAWARSIADESSDFDLNLRAAAKRVLVKSRHYGLTAYIVAAHLRLKTERTERPESQWVGDVGARFGAKKTPALVLTCERASSHATAYGTSYLNILRDAAGNCFKWFGGECLETGKAYTVAGTVKAHEEYKGVKQTVLTRCVAVKAGDDPTCGVKAGEWRIRRWSEGTETGMDYFQIKRVTPKGRVTRVWYRDDGSLVSESTDTAEYIVKICPEVCNAPEWSKAAA